MALASIAKGQESAGILVAKPKLALSGLTTPSASQISFGKPAQYWLTPASTIETSKRLAAKNNAFELDSVSTLEDRSGKSSNKKFCSLGRSTRVADAVSCTPNQTVITDVHEDWSRVRDLLASPYLLPKC